MALDEDSKLDAILNLPSEISEYQRWVEGVIRSGPAGCEDYLFAEEVPRFEAAQPDVLLAVDDVQVSRKGRGVSLRSEQAGAEVEVADLSEASARRLLGAIDGERTVAELEQLPEITPLQLGKMLKAAFGVLIFAPGAVERLERQLSGIEITRFPGSPYEIVRPYWENMISVRKRAAALEQTIGSVEQTVHLLRELHVLALMGEDLGTFYKPSSRITAKGIAPGGFLEGSSRTLDTPNGTLFLSGPRVNVSLIGGGLYHQALYTLVDDPDAAQSNRQLSDGKLDWGRIVTARAEGDQQEAPWFCPPRPMHEAHLQSVVGSLAEALEAAQRKDQAGTVNSLARFHQRFIRLHPFRCANQCLVMNLVNFVLNLSHGVGMPHQVLDHFALRLSESAYQRVFRAAVDSYLLTEGGPLYRYQELRTRKRRAFAFIQQLSACKAREEALELVNSCADDARLALFPV